MKLQKILKNLPLVFILLNTSAHTANRRLDEYKNSLINADAIGKNQDLYNSFKLDRVAMSTSEQLLAKGLKEGAKYHQQAIQ